MIDHASGRMVMEGDYGSVRWLCDSARGGSAVMQAEKGEKTCKLFYKWACMGLGCEMDFGGQLGLAQKQRQN